MEITIVKVTVSPASKGPLGVNVFSTWSGGSMIVTPAEAAGRFLQCCEEKTAEFCSTLGAWLLSTFRTTAW